MAVAETRTRVNEFVYPSTELPAIELPVSNSAKVLLLNEMIRQQVCPADLARRLKTTPQEVNRLTNTHHTSKIDGIAGALRVLGKKLVVRAV